MKKILYLCIVLGVSFMTMSFNMKVDAADNDWHFDNNNPVQVMKAVKQNANKNKVDAIQNTDYDTISSINCKDAIPPKYTISRTLCDIKYNSSDYLQYAIFIGLAAATIFLIWNGFKIVTSPDREKQIGIFKKNFLYTVIGVFLLIGFYYLIDMFVSVINLLTD